MRWNDRALTFTLVLAALGCGGWAAWPHVFPAPRAPQVTRAAPPQSPVSAPASPAPTYPVTASVHPLLNGKLNLNTATREQLEALPRIGPALAARIEAGRPYRSHADLDQVKGIGPVLLETLAPLVSY